MPAELIKAATNEWVLLLFRGSSIVFLGIITIFVTGTRDDVRVIYKDLNDFKIAYAERIARVEGQVGELKGSVEAHRGRLNGNDNDIRAIWGRVYEINRPSSQPQRGAP